MKIPDRILRRARSLPAAIQAAHVKQVDQNAVARAATIIPSDASVFTGRAPEYRGEPVLLYADTTVQPNSNGAPNIDALKNPNPGPMEITQIKFRISANGEQLSGGVVSCKLTLGDFVITNDFVPMFAFDGVDNAINEEDPGQNATTVTAIDTIVGTTQATIQDNIATEYCWHLPCPIWVPSGAVLVPQFFHRGTVTTPADVSVSYIARALPVGTPVPTKMRLPYIGVYNAKTFTLFETDSDQSTEKQLYNSTPEQLHLTKFVGRINYFGTTSSGTNASSEYEQQNAGSTGDALVYFNLTMIDSRGFPVVKNNTPFRNVFDQLTRTWDVDVVLDPGGYYIATINAAAGAEGSGAPAFTNAQPTITMQGWRKVQ